MPKTTSYRATCWLEFPDYENKDEQGRPTTVRVRPGDELPANFPEDSIAELEKHGSIEKERA